LDTEGIAWYEAFALWKTAIVVQQLWNRYVAGDTLDDRMIGLGERVPMLARSAAEVVDGLV
jgi:aminoglycoside phosphotransferase (APT) family kinase protein